MVGGLSRRDHLLFVYAKIRKMKIQHYLFLTLLLVLFFGTNYFIYTSSFEVSGDRNEANVVDTIQPKEIAKEYPSVLNFGDVMFDRGVRNIMENRGRDPFEYIKKDLDVLKKFDIIVANLEGPIVEMDRSKCQSKAYNFQFASTAPELLKSVGINMVNIANNHTQDCFSAGYESTKKFLKESRIDYVGEKELEKSYVLGMIDNKKVAFVGVDQTISPTLSSNFYSLITKLDLENDYVIVNIHWGTEYELQTTSAQVVIAHNLIDSGADVIFGHHPHVVEPIEVYKGKAIFYSLGNFVFDQDFGETTVGLGAGVEFRDEKSFFTIFPFNIKLFAPEFMKDEERDIFCQKFLVGLSRTDCSFEI